MNEEIKEILEQLKDSVDYPKFDMPTFDGTDSEFIDNDTLLEPDKCKLLLDYITNLQQENEKLNEDNILIKSGNQLLSKKINKILELVNDIEWRLDDVHDLIDCYDEIKEIINIGEINE